MEVDAVRIACPACGKRLTIMPRVEYVACTHCGSEYLVQRRGNAVGLEPFAQEQYDISKQIAAVEQSQGEGCSNVFFWILLVTAVLFCGLGFLGRTLFHNNNTLLILGWAISMLVLVLAAGVLLRVLNTQRFERLNLEAKQQALQEKRDEEAESPASEYTRAFSLRGPLHWMKHLQHRVRQIRHGSASHNPAQASTSRFLW